MTSPEQDTRDPVAYLAEISARLDATTPAKWIVSAKHGRDIADEGWSELRVISLPDREPVALTYLSGILEPDKAEENAELIAHCREDLARLLAGYYVLLKAHQPGRFVIAGSVCKRHESHPHFSITAAEAADVQACAACKATVYRQCTGCTAPVDQCAIRSAIAAALAGEETPS